MPTYDYQCDACDATWEVFQKITDDPIKKCPACRRQKARRLFGTGAAVVFKGSGFYQTDYRSESYKKGEKAAKGETTKPDGGTDKSESPAVATADKTKSSNAGSDAKPKKHRKSE
jgi:putative FmdB family regulatory protein